MHFFLGSFLCAFTSALTPSQPISEIADLCGCSSSSDALFVEELDKLMQFDTSVNLQLPGPGYHESDPVWDSEMIRLLDSSAGPQGHASKGRGTGLFGGESGGPRCAHESRCHLLPFGGLQDRPRRGRRARYHPGFRAVASMPRAFYYG